MMLDQLVYRNESYSRKYDVQKMAVAVVPEGVVTHQTPKEKYGEKEKDWVAGMPEPIRSDADSKLQLSQYVANIYNDFMGSRLGEDFRSFIRIYGNSRKDSAGALDDILVGEDDSGLIAATHAQGERRDLIINAKNFRRFSEAISRYSGKLSTEDSALLTIMHELGHNYLQNYHELNQTDYWNIETNLDYKLIDFFLGMAERDSENSDYYTEMAKALTLRYDGETREEMQEYIAGKSGEESDSKDRSNTESGDGEESDSGENGEEAA